MNIRISALLVLMLAFYACSKHHYNIASLNIATLELDSSATMSSNIDDIIEPYRSALVDTMGHIIGYNKGDMYKSRPEGELNNFMADAILEIGRQNSRDTIHAAISNYGGIRIPILPIGNITTGNMFELMPFENFLSVLEISGTDLHLWCNMICVSGGWPVSNDFSFSIDTTNQTCDYKLLGQAIEEDKNYRIITSDYIANGGDRCEFLQDLDREDLGILYRDALIQYVEQLNARGDSLHVLMEGRINYE